MSDILFLYLAIKIIFNAIKYDFKHYKYTKQSMSIMVIKETALIIKHSIAYKIVHIANMFFKKLGVLTKTLFFRDFYKA